MLEKLSTLIHKISSLWVTPKIEDNHIPLPVKEFVELVSNQKYDEAALFIIKLYKAGNFITVLDCMEQTRLVGIDFKDYKPVLIIIKIYLKDEEDSDAPKIILAVKMLKEVLLLGPQ